MSVFPEALSSTAKSSEVQHIFSNPGAKRLARWVSKSERSHLIKDRATEHVKLDGHSSQRMHNCGHLNGHPQHTD